MKAARYIPVLFLVASGCATLHITTPEEQCLENLRALNTTVFLGALDAMQNGTNSFERILCELTGSTNVPVCPAGGKYVDPATRAKCTVHGDLLGKYGTGFEGLGFNDPPKERRRFRGIALPDQAVEADR